MDGELPRIPGPQPEPPSNSDPPDSHDDRHDDRRDDSHDNRHDNRHDNSAQRRGHEPRGSGIPTPEEIKAFLAALAGLVLTGFISASRANTIQRILDSLLRHSRSDSAEQLDQNVDVDALRKLLIENPQLADRIAPFLAPGVLENIFRGGEGQP